MYSVVPSISIDNKGTSACGLENEQRGRFAVEDFQN
jgi:hypothetical protein